MKTKQTIYNKELMQLFKQYNIKCKKTVYANGIFTYYIDKQPEKKLINILVNNYSNYTGFCNFPVPVITIL